MKKVIVIGDSEEMEKKTLRNSLLSLACTPIESQPIESQPIENVLPSPLPPRKSSTGAITALTALAMWGVCPLPKPKKEIPLHKCGLKECNVLTVRDFCCAEHCNIAKAKHKKS
jgi:hypothetical protein